MSHHRSFADAASPLSAAMAVARAPLLAVCTISLFLNLLYLTMPIYMLQIYDRVLTSGSTATLHYLTLIAAAALLVLGLLEALRSAALSRISSWVDRQLSGTVLGGSVELALSGRNPGAQLLRDLAQLRSFMRDGLRPMLDAPWMPVFVVVIWWMHPWLGVVALISAGLLFLLAVANDVITRRPLRAANAGLVTAHQQAEASLRNADVIRAMGMLPNMLQRWTALNDLLLRRQQTAADRSGMILGISRFLRLFVQIGVLGLGAYLVLEGELTAGGIVAASVLLGRALAPIEQAIGAWREFASARSSWQRLEGLFETVAPGPPLMRLPAPAGRLDLERASFVPPGASEPVLKQISLQLRHGQVLGVIGPSASGKSTLCRLIVGIWKPTAGHVRLDGAEVHAWDPVDLGEHVGYLPQDVELFAGTVKENIARMNAANADVDAAVVAAAKLADVHELVLRLPDGYDTQIGEGGEKLSGGQRQRIGLARALYCEPRLVVLDEPNANLDHDGEEALSRAIVRLKGQGTTVVLVAHRPRLLIEADQIVVLREGTVQMIGNYDEVVERYGMRSEPARLHQVR